MQWKCYLMAHCWYFLYLMATWDIWFSTFHRWRGVLCSADTKPIWHKDGHMFLTVLLDKCENIHVLYIYISGPFFFVLSILTQGQSHFHKTGNHETKNKQQTLQNELFVECQNEAIKRFVLTGMVYISRQLHTGILQYWKNWRFGVHCPL